MILPIPAQFKKSKVYPVFTSRLQAQSCKLSLAGTHAGFTTHTLPAAGDPALQPIIHNDSMLKTLKNLFDSLIAPVEETPQAQDHALKLATAVLLVEVMRADPASHADERQAVLASLREKFALQESELSRLVELAVQTAQSASDYHQFTSRINATLDHSQKIRIVEHMWQVAYADDHLHANENQLISKIAGLLHVTHGEYIGAKLRAKEAASLA